MVHVGGGVRIRGIEPAGRRRAAGGAAGRRVAERLAQHAAARLRLFAGLEDLGQDEVVVEFVVDVERERLDDGFVAFPGIERSDQLDAGPRRCVNRFLEQVGGGELGVVPGDVEHRLHALVREVDADLHVGEPVADIGMQSDQAGTLGQGHARGPRSRGTAALERDLAAGLRALDPQLDLVLGLGQEQPQTRTVADKGSGVVARLPAVLDQELDRRAAAQALAGAVRQQHRVVAAKPLTQEVGAGGCGPHPGRLGFILVAEGVVRDLDLDLELLRRHVFGVVYPRRHPVDHAGVLRPEFVAGDPGVLFEFDGEPLALEGGLPTGRDNRLGGGLDDQIGHAEHPFLFRELGRWRQVATRPLGPAALDPGHHDVDLALAHPPRVAEVVVAGIGGPRRHAAGEQFLLDGYAPGAGAGLGVVAVGGQVDVVGRRPLRVVARHAVAPKDGAHVVGVVDVGGDANVRRCGIGGDPGQRQRRQADHGRGRGDGSAVAGRSPLSHCPSPE